METEIVKHKSLIGSYKQDSLVFEKLLELTEEYFKSPSAVWRKADINKKIALQWFVFPKGVTYNGEKMQTNEIPFIYIAKKEFITSNSPQVGVLGIEPHAKHARKALYSTDILHQEIINISNYLSRGAGNRTQPACSQSMYTTDILHPVYLIFTLTFSM